MHRRTFFRAVAAVVVAPVAAPCVPAPIIIPYRQLLGRVTISGPVLQAARRSGKGSFALAAITQMQREMLHDFGRQR